MLLNLTAAADLGAATNVQAHTVCWWTVLPLTGCWFLTWLAVPTNVHGWTAQHQ